jgi:hypothetical protein
MSMPIVATVKFDLLDMAVLLCWFAPSKHHSLEGREHGRTIPLADSRPARLLADRRFRPLSCIGAGASDRGKAYTSATGIAKVLNDRGIPTIRGYRKATKERADAIR